MRDSTCRERRRTNRGGQIVKQGWRKQSGQMGHGQGQASGTSVNRAPDPGTVSTMVAPHPSSMVRQTLNFQDMHRGV